MNGAALPRVLRRIPPSLLAAVLAALGFLLPTGLENVGIPTPTDVVPLRVIDEARNACREVARIAGPVWAVGGLAVMAVVCLLWALRAGRLKPESPHLAHTFVAWITVVASAMVVSVALVFYTDPLGFGRCGAAGFEGFGFLVLMAVSLPAAAIALAGAAVLRLTSRPERVSAFRSGAAALGWTSPIYLLVAFRFL